METVNVFGGTGFIGSHYVGTYPNCIVNKRNDYTVRTNNILYFISTVDNYNIFTNPHLDIDTNLTTLINVLETIPPEQRSSTTFNFISSWFVYGDTDLPAKETSYCNPKGFYSITKRTAEQLLISYCETYNINYRILRLANVVGISDQKASPKKNAIVHMIKMLKEHNPIKLYDGGELYRDIIDMEDCVHAIHLVLQKGELNTVYNISNGIPVKFIDIIERAKELTKSTSTITFVETPQFHKIIQVKSMYMDNSKLTSLGYTPKYCIDDIIKRIV